MPRIALSAEEATGASGAEGADEAPSLGTSRTTLRTEASDLLDRARSVRTERRRVRNAVSRIMAARADELELPKPRVSHCGHSVAGGGVTVVKGAQGIARISGLQRCANIWLCAECSARIRAGRATEIAQAANLWTRHHDGALLFVTLTVAHKAGDDVATLIDAVISSWSALTSSSWWAGDFRPDRPPRYGVKQRYGLAGYVRSIEVTDGHRNGLHAHVHALFFVDKTPGPDMLESLGDEIFEKWATHVERRGARRPDRVHGVDVQLCGDDGKVLAQYMSKVITETSVGFEMARSDVKRGRKWRRFTPWELAIAADEGDEWARQRFVDYAEATKGRRAITWSRDLRDVLGMAAEKTDEELLDEIEALDDMIGEPVLTMTNDEWRALRVVDGGPELLLDLVEGDRLEVARTLVSAAVAARGAP